jgi:Cd2+/Zn2+-exporting ATPase
VTDVQVGVMSERLSLRLTNGTTAQDRIETTVRKLAYGIARQGSDTQPAPIQHHDHDHATPIQPTPAPHDASGHGGPGHSHATAPANLGKPWYQTAKGKLVAGTGLLLAAATAVNLASPGPVAHWAFVLACLIGVAPVARRALAALNAGIPFTIEALMTIAAIGALVIGAAA